MPLPLQPKKHTKKDIARWLLEFYDIDNNLTHMYFINQIFRQIEIFLRNNDLPLPENETAFRAKIISYLYHNSSHKKYQLRYQNF
tara:strand:- start:291 stop:545 length:255 start_codon:yes stop_codon:yes gene_type:complete